MCKHYQSQSNPSKEDEEEFKKDWTDSILNLSQTFIDFNLSSDSNLSDSNPQSSSVSNFLGFIFIHHQTSILDEDQKLKPFDLINSIEISPILGEIIWAPLNEGSKVRLLGCSYLIQSTNHPNRTSLTNSNLIDSLKTLGQLGLSVEFLVEGNLDRSAPSVLEEILECVSVVRTDQEIGQETKFLISEMGKPHMVTSHSVVPSSASYSSILSHLFSLSLFSNLSIKLSGLPILIDLELAKGALTYYDQFRKPYHESAYSLKPKPYNEIQLDGKEEENEVAWKEIKKRMKFYLEPILEAFGDHRIMYSSDFPGFGSSFDEIEEMDERLKSNLKSNYYECQFELFRECLSELGLEGETLDNVFGLNAKKWYGL
ncbi:hypothetical protein DFH28DRAFT_980466 [Melampsora americana]|nr:hypothetical protein DFH28DRAFT_980466 [Melampsora americana]